MVNRTFDWSRVDLNKRVYVRRQNQENRHEQMDQYKNRTTVNLTDLRRGIMTLQISSVQLNDSGQYKCFVPTLWTGCFVNVTVREQDHQSKKKHVAITTRPATDEPGKPGGEKWKLEIVIPIGILVPIGILGLFGTVVLVRRGTIPNPITRFRGRRGQKAEVTNGTELNPLRTSSANAGPDPDDSTCK